MSFGITVLSHFPGYFTDKSLDSWYPNYTGTLRVALFEIYSSTITLFYCPKSLNKWSPSNIFCRFTTKSNVLSFGAPKNCLAVDCHSKRLLVISGIYLFRQGRFQPCQIWWHTSCYIAWEEDQFVIAQLTNLQSENISEDIDLKTDLEDENEENAFKHVRLE